MPEAEKRVLLIGREGVGKYALQFRYFANDFLEEPYYGMRDIMRKRIQMDSTVAILDVLDMHLHDDDGGKELNRLYLEQASDWSFVGVYSVDDRASLVALQEFFSGPIKAPVKLIATKCDLSGRCRQVTVHEGERTAASLGCTVMEVSSKENIQVDEAFASIIRVTPDFVGLSGRRKKRITKCAIS